MSRTRRDVAFVYAMDLPERVSSYRYMSIIPAQEIGARFLRFEANESADDFLDRVGAEAYVFGKAIDDDRLAALCERARARGAKTISWHCDAPVAPGALERLKRQAAASDALVVQTVPMAEMVEEMTGVRPHIIEECLEYPPLPATHFQDRSPLQLLWYGHVTNLDSVAKMLEDLAFGLGREAVLLMLGAGAPPKPIASLLERFKAPPLEVTWLPWSREFQLQAMRSCDVVLTPSFDNAAKHVKGHNRVSEALNQSCVVVAHPLRQYTELGDFVFLSPSMSAGVRQALADPQTARARAEAGFQAARNRFAPSVLAKKWNALIEDVLEKA